MCSRANRRVLCKNGNAQIGTGMELDVLERRVESFPGVGVAALVWPVS